MSGVKVEEKCSGKDSMEIINNPAATYKDAEKAIADFKKLSKEDQARAFGVFMGNILPTSRKELLIPDGKGNGGNGNIDGDSGDKGTGEVIKVGNMNEFFNNTEFGISLKDSVSKTSAIVKGESVYRIDKKIDNPILDKGDGIYLDSLHKDHLEVVNKRGKVKAVLNLDGTLNVKKTEIALKENRSIEW